MFKWMWIALLLFLINGSGILAQSAYDYQIPIAMGDGWTVSHLTDQSVDPVPIQRFLLSIPANKNHNLHSLLLVKDDHLILEHYFEDNHATTQHDLRSVTKSITSLLLGIAVDKDFIKSIDDPILKYLPAYKILKNDDPEKQNITIRHLITMSSGLECNDWDKKSKGQEDKMYKKKDWVKFILDLPMSTNPGDTSLYCTGGVVVLGEIISYASGQNLDAFAHTNLFEPLGISNYKWSYIKKSDKVDSGGHLYMTPRDMAKIGQLILNKGVWKNKRIVSAGWIDESTRIHTHISHVNYGFLWWRIPFSMGQYKIESICATGNGGQYIIIVPELNLVSVFTGGNYNSEKSQIPLAIFQKVILAAQLD